MFKNLSIIYILLSVYVNYVFPQAINTDNHNINISGMLTDYGYKDRKIADALVVILETTISINTNSEGSFQLKHTPNKNQNYIPLAIYHPDYVPVLQLPSKKDEIVLQKSIISKKTYFNKNAGLSITDPRRLILSGIISSYNNIPIPNAVVLLAGTTYETVTDINGKFIIDYPIEYISKEFSEYGIIVRKYGFADSFSHFKTLTNKNNINISMLELTPSAKVDLSLKKIEEIEKRIDLLNNLIHSRNYYKSDNIDSTLNILTSNIIALKDTLTLYSRFTKSLKTDNIILSERLNSKFSLIDNYSKIVNELNQRINSLELSYEEQIKKIDINSSKIDSLIGADKPNLSYLEIKYLYAQLNLGIQGKNLNNRIYWSNELGISFINRFGLNIIYGKNFKNDFNHFWIGLFYDMIFSKSLNITFGVGATNATNKASDLLKNVNMPTFLIRLTYSLNDSFDVNIGLLEVLPVRSDSFGSYDFFHLGIIRYKLKF